MTTITGPQIACQRCGTTVPWGPYCPHCSAYLEFAGIPPWSPDGPPPSPEAAVAAAQDDSPAATSQGPAATTQSPTEAGVQTDPEDAGPAVEPEAAIAGESGAQGAPGPDDVELPAVSILGGREAAPDSIDAPVAGEVGADMPAGSGDAPAAGDDAGVRGLTTAAAESGFSRWRRGIGHLQPSQITGYAFGVALAVLLTVLFGMLGGWGTAWFAAPFLIAWAVIAVGAFGTVPDVDHEDEVAAEAARIAAEEEAARIAAEEEAARIAAEEEAARRAAEAAAAEDATAFRELVGADARALDEMASRPPQPVERTVKAGRAGSGRHEAVRDIACLTCGKLNITGHRLCEFCGAPMEGAQVKPPVEPVLETRVLETEEQEKKKRRRRRAGPSRSWRAPAAILALVAVVIGAFAFAFFGPGALQLRFSTGRAYQLVARWINPYLGETASVATVTSSSNLSGAEATEAGFGDARTFWASAPAKGYGAGSELVFTFASPTDIDRLVIFPGIQNGQFDIRALATPKDITLTFETGATVKTKLAEIESAQQQRQLVPFDAQKTGWVKLTIDSVYPPRGKSADGVGSVAISGSQFLESPPTPQFFGVQNGPIAPKLPGAGG